MGENGMTKYVINTVEIIKRVYLVDAYSESEALDKNIERGPESADKVEVLGEMTYSIETINEYEYQKDWVQEASGRKDRVEDITTSGKLRHKSEWVYAQNDGRLEQQKKDHEGYLVEDYYDK